MIRVNLGVFPQGCLSNMSNTIIPQKKLSIKSKSIEEEISEAKLDLADLKSEMKEQRSLLIVGFAVLLVMVVTILVMVLLQYIGSLNSLNDRIDNLQAQISHHH